MPSLGGSGCPCHQRALCALSHRSRPRANTWGDDQCKWGLSRLSSLREKSRRAVKSRDVVLSPMELWVIRVREEASTFV